MNGLSILGTGRCLPDHIVTNDDLARRVETSNDWIVSRTGIREGVGRAGTLRAQ